MTRGLFRTGGTLWSLKWTLIILAATLVGGLLILAERVGLIRPEPAWKPARRGGRK